MTTSSVLLDTDVFSALAIDPLAWERRGQLLDPWREALSGLSVVVSFQSRAEVLSGLRGSNWGRRRLADALATLDATPTIGADTEVIEAFATLTVKLKASGHGLHQKIHTADRWVAACAIAKGIPLFARDGIYADAPGLTLFEVPNA